MPFTPELNLLYENCYQPTIKNNNLDPIVLNKTRDGSPVYSQIVSNIQTSYIVIADLTIARPNCYFEVGFTIGQGKQDQLIMCCREDHLTDSPNNPRQRDKAFLLFNLIRRLLPNSLQKTFNNYFFAVLDQHKIHFDLAGYNVLCWNQSKKDDFVAALDSEIKQRIKILESRAEDVNSETGVQVDGVQGKAQMSEKDIAARLNAIGQDQAKGLKDVKN